MTESAIAQYLKAKHGRSAMRSYHMLDNTDRDALVAEHGPGIVEVIRRVANDPSWVPKV